MFLRNHEGLSRARVSTYGTVGTRCGEEYVGECCSGVSEGEALVAAYLHSMIYVSGHDAPCPSKLCFILSKPFHIWGTSLYCLRCKIRVSSTSTSISKQFLDEYV